jgi:hypothetical protein
MKKNILSSDIYWLEECIKSIPYGEATLKVVIHNRKVKYTVRAASQTILAESDIDSVESQRSKLNEQKY